MVRTYDIQRGFLAYLHDSYWGGDRWRTPSSLTIGTATLLSYTVATADDGSEGIVERRVCEIRSYLTPHSAETETDFRQRASLAVYVNMVSPIADTYAGAVTGHVTRDLGEMGAYLSNVDGQGASWPDHIEEVARWAAVYGMVAVLFDAPSDTPAKSRAEELASGASLRAVMTPPTAWAWIDVDATGTVREFAYVDAPYQTRDATSQTVTLWCWTQTTWEQHEIALACNAPAPMEFARNARSDATRKKSGDISPRLNGRVPVAFAYYRRDGSTRWPSGVSLVADAADLCRMVYNLLSSAEEQIRKTFFSFLAVPTKDAGGQLAPETRIQVGPSIALPFPSDTGIPSYVAPRAETTAEIRAHCIFLLALALRLAGLEATTQDATAPSSGVALRIRSRGFESRAASFAKGMLRYERTALDLAAAYLGMDASKLKVQYPQRFTLPDASEDLDRAVLLIEKLGDRLGAEGMLAAVRQALTSALALSDEDLAKVLADVRKRLDGGASETATKGDGETIAPEITKVSAEPTETATATATSAAEAEPAAESDASIAPAAGAPQVAAPTDLLNGAQITSMVEIVTAVATRQLPRPAGIGMLQIAFRLSPEQAELVMGAVGTTFFAEQPGAVPATAKPNNGDGNGTEQQDGDGGDGGQQRDGGDGAGAADA